MSTKKTRRPKSKEIRLQVLCEKASGRILAAGPMTVTPTGDNGPEEVRFVPLDSEVCEVVTLTRDQALLAPPDLFANHVVKSGRLVPTKRGD